jgi:Sortase domain
MGTATSRRRGLAWVVATVLALSGVLLVVRALGDSGQTPPSPAPVAAASTSPSPKANGGGHVAPAAGTHKQGAGRGGVADLVSGPALPQSVPLRVTIPRLGITSGLVRLGLDSGAMEVPSDPAVAGWYALGPTPGQLGPAVIAGHVTWNLEPAVFYRLSELRAGDRVRVASRDGRTRVFRVDEVRRFAKSRFPTNAVFGTIDYAGLRLITCGGTYDSASHRYLDNVIAFARLVRVVDTAR